MSMGVFMPPPAPLMGGGGPTLDGTITVGDYAAAVFGWSDGSVIPMSFGSLSGDASPYFAGYFMWAPADGEGVAFVNGDLTGSVLSFQGRTYNGYYTGEASTGFIFGPEVASWPTSGTYPFTLTLP